MKEKITNNGEVGKYLLKIAFLGLVLSGGF